MARGCRRSGLTQVRARRVLGGGLSATERQSAARDLEAATVEYYEGLTAADRREDEAMAAASSVAARRLRVDDRPIRHL